MCFQDLLLTIACIVALLTIYFLDNLPITSVNSLRISKTSLSFNLQDL